jgi:hypothetical protein
MVQRPLRPQREGRGFQTLRAATRVSGNHLRHRAEPGDQVVRQSTGQGALPSISASGNSKHGSPFTGRVAPLARFGLLRGPKTATATQGRPQNSDSKSSNPRFREPPESRRHRVDSRLYPFPTPGPSLTSARDPKPKEAQAEAPSQKAQVDTPADKTTGRGVTR